MDPKTNSWMPLTPTERELIQRIRAAEDGEMPSPAGPVGSLDSAEPPAVSGAAPAPPVSNRDLEWDDRLELITGVRLERLHQTAKVLFNVDIQMTPELEQHLTPKEAAYLRGWMVDIMGFVRKQMLNTLKGALKYECYNGPPEYWQRHWFDETVDCVNYAIRATAVREVNNLLDPHDGVPPIPAVDSRPPHAHEPGGTTFPRAAHLRERSSHPDMEGVIPPGGAPRYITADEAALSGCPDNK